MKILKKEVKTVYNISLDLLDFANAFEVYKISPLKDIGEYEGAFADCSTENDVASLMKKFHDKSLNSALCFIVKEYLHFGGIINYGYYNEYEGVYTMTVYRRGNTMEEK